MAWGNDGAFGSDHTAAAMKYGLDLWDTAVVYGMETSEDILGGAGRKISAVQDHFSLLDRSSEDSGILDHCKENGIVFYAYMVLEQGALSGN